MTCVISLLYVGLAFFPSSLYLSLSLSFSQVRPLVISLPYVGLPGLLPELEMVSGIARLVSLCLCLCPCQVRPPLFHCHILAGLLPQLRNGIWESPIGQPLSLSFFSLHLSLSLSLSLLSEAPCYFIAICWPSSLDSRWYLGLPDQSAFVFVFFVFAFVFVFVFAK